MTQIKHAIKALLILILFLIFSCSEDAIDIPDDKDDVDDQTIVEKPNILLIIADDLGKDAINGFSEGTIKPLTPNIDAIRNNGLSFNNFWVNPTCTPTRSSIITGKYGYRTGVKGVGDELSLTETTLQSYINSETNNSYATAIVGKWHLSGSNASVNPESYGIDYYAGLIRGAVNDYYDWEFTENGSSSSVTEYATEKFTNLSIDWVNNQNKPWFLWLAYNAPHTPFHVPPTGTHNQGALPNYTNALDPTPYYMAAVESMDYQIGRLLDNIPNDEKENTIIIFIGDNGTPPQVAQNPYTSNTVKNTLYQGGINTPMFISGTGLTRTGVDNNLITSTDLFATIGQIAGSSSNIINDSKSFKSLFSNSETIRNFQYSEINDVTIDEWTISNGNYKLIVSSNNTQQLYNLLNDPYESNNLLNGSLSTTEQTAKNALETELSNIRN